MSANGEDEEEKKYEGYFGVELPSLSLGVELSPENAFLLRFSVSVFSQWFLVKHLLRAQFGSKNVDRVGVDIFVMLLEGIDVDDDNKLHFNTQTVFNRTLWLILPDRIYKVSEDVRRRIDRVSEDVRRRFLSSKKGGGIHSELLVEEVSADKGMPIPNGYILYSVNGPDDAMYKLLKHFIPHANMDAMINELIDKMKNYDNYEEFIKKEIDLVNTFVTKLALYVNIKNKRNRSTRSVRSTRSSRRTRSARF